jgi:hypothetical protein
MRSKGFLDRMSMLRILAVFCDSFQPRRKRLFQVLPATCRQRQKRAGPGLKPGSARPFSSSPTGGWLGYSGRRKGSCAREAARLRHRAAQESRKPSLSLRAVADRPLLGPISFDLCHPHTTHRGSSRSRVDPDVLPRPRTCILHSPVFSRPSRMHRR